MASLTDKRHWQIRRIFLQPHDDYSVVEAARLLSTKRADLLRAIEGKEIDSIARTEFRLTWETIADLALRQWPLEMIYEALGDQADEILPPLLRVEELRLRVPAYVVRLVNHLARTRGVSVDELMRAEFHDFANAVRIVNPEIDDELPGFAEALFFPSEPR